MAEIEGARILSFIESTSQRSPIRAIIGSPAGVVTRRLELALTLGAFGCGVTDVTDVNEPPAVTITIPAANASFMSGDTVTFVGSATDPEDGALDGASLVWTSSLDGPLGTGATLRPANLTPGQHVIRLTAIDARGLSAFVERDAGVRVRWTQISAGGEGNAGHSCGVAVTGDAFCWGLNFSGQLGISAIDDYMTTPRRVAGSRKWLTISAGMLHSCGVATTGEAYCWGYNFGGFLGVGTTQNERAPVLVLGGHRWTKVITRGLTCGITTAGEMYCWGNNSSGAVGNGVTGNIQSTPALVLGGHSWSDLSVGWQHTCGVTIEGEAYCWGDNSGGKLGNGSTTATSTPVLVAGNRKWSRISAGMFHTCGRTSANEAYCWGFNFGGQLGAGTTAETSSIPLAVVGGHVWNSIAGGNFSCGVASSGNGYCWGENASGQLGDGSTTSRSTPTAIAEVGGWRALSAGSASSPHTCGVKATGEGYCWGYNRYGQIGDNSVTLRTTPVLVLPPGR